MESFLETQRRMVNRFESGFSGYRGLSGKFRVGSVYTLELTGEPV